MNGAIFGLKTTSDYNAIMNYARITPPEIKSSYVDIEGGDSSIDLTEAVGGVHFKNGTIDFKFTFHDSRSRDEMKNDLHGKRMKFTLERDFDFYYDGRLSFDREEREKNLYVLYMSASVKPYKYEKRITTHIETVNGEEKEIIIPNSRMPVMPVITVTGNVYLQYDGMGFSFNPGTYEVAEVTFYEGFNRMLVSGNGTIKFEYRKGRII